MKEGRFDHAPGRVLEKHLSPEAVRISKEILPGILDGRYLIENEPEGRVIISEADTAKSLLSIELPILIESWSARLLTLRSLDVLNQWLGSLLPGLQSGMYGIEYTEDGERVAIIDIKTKKVLGTETSALFREMQVLRELGYDLQTASIGTRPALNDN